MIIEAKTVDELAAECRAFLKRYEALPSVSSADAEGPVPEPASETASSPIREAYERLVVATNPQALMGDLRAACERYLQATQGPAAPLKEAKPTELGVHAPLHSVAIDAWHKLNGYLSTLQFKVASTLDVERVRDLSIAVLADHRSATWDKYEGEDDSDGETLARLGVSAERWADDFCAIAERKGIDVDRGWMVTWFANAIEQSARIHPEVRRLKARITVMRHHLRAAMVAEVSS